MSRYHDVYAAWQRDPLAFWAAAASAIDWFEPWEAVLAPPGTVSTATSPPVMASGVP